MANNPSNRWPRNRSIELSGSDYQGLLDDIEEARKAAREILEFFDGQGLRPAWEDKYWWLKE